jgi:uncharacterized protein YqgV (UPF0045/DUF77 family)
MIVQVEVSLYPLETAEIGKIIDAFIGRLSRPGLRITQGNMSTSIEGEMLDAFQALNEAFGQVASSNAVVMSVRMSNACPPCGSMALRHSPQLTTEEQSRC